MLGFAINRSCLGLIPDEKSAPISNVPVYIYIYLYIQYKYINVLTYVHTRIHIYTQLYVYQAYIGHSSRDGLANCSTNSGGIALPKHRLSLSLSRRWRQRDVLRWKSLRGQSSSPGSISRLAFLSARVADPLKSDRIVRRGPADARVPGYLSKLNVRDELPLRIVFIIVADNSCDQSIYCIVVPIRGPRERLRTSQAWFKNDTTLKIEYLA